MDSYGFLTIPKANVTVNFHTKKPTAYSQPRLR
ncbi:hypothetical protein RDI58_026386 [Solanum bulbocastanum]|uniref:Uncharacterized protein n=1 Tax=Solanum bulbocastanum TaxID=147425 RepID=A0AAN8STM9_SOLBU